MARPEDPFASLSKESRSRLRVTAQPAWIDPMLATLTGRRFSDPAWLFERKLDGQRCIAFRHDGEVRLFSRARQPLNGTYPEVADSLRTQEHEDFVIDGEVVAFDGDRTSFELLQQRLGISDAARSRRVGVPVFYYAFDVLHLDGRDIRPLALRDRKILLARAIEFKDPIRFTDHREGDGEAFLEQACRKGWEGLIAKRGASPYSSRRSRDWLKFKCSSSQELVVGGFTEPSGSRLGLGALLVGYFADGDLVYAGKVGTGYTEAVLRDLRKRLDRLEVARSPFSGARIAERTVHWVRPELVCEVLFSEWTRDGKLRHPRFGGLRFDKEAREVVREVPSPSPTGSST